MIELTLEIDKQKRELVFLNGKYVFNSFRYFKPYAKNFSHTINPVSSVRFSYNLKFYTFEQLLNVVPEEYQMAMLYHLDELRSL